MWSISMSLVLELVAGMMWKHRQRQISSDIYDVRGSKLACSTFWLADQSSPTSFAELGRNRCRLLVFPILNFSTCSGDIRDLDVGSFIKSPRILHVFGPKYGCRVCASKPSGLGVAAVGRRTSDLAAMRSIPGPGVIKHLGQLSLPSLRDK